MKAAKNTVVSFHYRLNDEHGEMVEDSHQKAPPPMALLGYKQIVPGLESAMLEHEPGDQFSVSVEPGQGYGPHLEDMIQRLSKKYFQHAARLKPGMSTTLNLREGGQRMVTVHKIGMSTIDVDVNHPMAGKVLHFDIEVLDVREATPKELVHGRAHLAEAQHD